MLAVVALCSSCGSSTEHSRVLVSPDGFRTFTIVTSVRGVPATCATDLAPEPHVEGVLDGDQGAKPEPAWLRDASGDSLSILWPEGFHLVFQPRLTLVDNRGRTVAELGDHVELNESRASHAGTFEDPYVAQSIVGRSECFLFRP